MVLVLNIYPLKFKISVASVHVPRFCIYL